MLQRFTSRGQQSQPAELPALARKMLHRRSALSSYMQLMTLLSVLPVLGIAVVSLAVSFNTQDHALDTGMVLYLEISTLFGIAGFLCHTIFLNPSSQFLSWVDYALGAGALGFTIAWTVNRSWGHFTNLEQVVFIILGFYMAIRTWYYCVKEHGLVGEYLGWSREVIALESFKLVWVVRSLSLAQEILPEIEAIQRSASTVWGSALHNVQNVAVYITDSDVKARNQFVQSMRSRVPNVQLFRLVC